MSYIVNSLFSETVKSVPGIPRYEIPKCFFPSISCSISFMSYSVGVVDVSVEVLGRQLLDCLYMLD